ncbi:olfactory receptor 10A7-like [Ambystoma mexicanum]|uniref:olfactory receptor 10A7-like n=1 Tax=Ambystoma mexicanum TaxID=8296 RepID=UPI0037E9BECA
MGNASHVTEFILLGFPGTPEFRLFLFATFLILYLLTLMGNFMMVSTVTADHHLKKPMYLFLRSLSFTEICYTTVTVPKMLQDLLCDSKSISFLGCATQLYFFCFLGTTECFILAVMAYDRYVAICHPLRYAVVMSKKNCHHLSTASWTAGILLALGQISFVFSLNYCGPNVIDHFFCDILPVVRLACSVTFQNEIAILVYGTLVIPLPFLLVLVSYAHILRTVLRMESITGRQKVFSTCASHIVSVSLFYGTATVTYLNTRSVSGKSSGKGLSLFYCFIIPMLNPLIYSLRNKEVQDAFRKILSSKRHRLI